MAAALKKTSLKVGEAIARVSLLVVDSDDNIRSLVRKVLIELGFRNIEEASNGYDAAEILKRCRTDLVITDWELRLSEKAKTRLENSITKTKWGNFPPNNGVSFVKFIRSGKTTIDQFIPIIMLTGPTEPNTIFYARDAGVNEILMKPLDANNICQRLINIIDNPRIFVTSENYRGPCRRRKNIPWDDKEERRTHTIQIIRHKEETKVVIP